MDELALTERLIAFDTASPEGVRRAAEFVGGWLESNDIEARQITSRGLPVTMAEVGPAEAPTLVMHGHLDVVPAEPEQFHPRLEGDRLIGRGAYDMKGALAVMMLVLREAREQSAVRLRLGIVCDEESEEEDDRGSDALIADGFIGDFAITGEPTNLQVGVQAKGVLAMRLAISGRSAHGATPWLGDNAIVKAVEVFRGIESLPFARQSSQLFDRPSINLGRIKGGDALNRVPDHCVMDVDVRFLPEQDPEQILEQVNSLPDTRVLTTFRRPPAVVEADSPFVLGLCQAASPHHPERVMSVGRDGASDAVSFLGAGVPAVEFGPVGDGHHGPEEWVSVSSLRSYRHALEGFVKQFPGMVPVMVPSPEKGSGNGEGERDIEEPREDTQEFELPDDTGEEELHPEPVAEDDHGDDVDDRDDADDSPGPDTELEEIINAETQEWEGIDPDDDAPDDDASDDDASDDEDFDDEPAHDDAEKTLVQSARSTVTSGFKAVGKKMRFPLWARFMTASLLIVASVAAATSASLLLYLSDIADALDPDKEFAGITDRLQGVEGGEPQTIMILGSDKRPELKGDGFRGLSDTTMLLRVDPDENALALFSLPRDLRVDIPGYGSDKLNAAYAYGGPELTLRTVQQLTETPDTPNGLEINHVVNIDFEGFARAVNEIDCVYVDVDRRYFNTNDDFGEDYEEIDIQPGYQALCGFDALDYARYRHTDNDVVRAARQQDFLREARQKVPPEVLFAERKDLIDVFTKHTTSDIDSVDDMLEVLKLFIEARDAPLKQVKFEGTLGPSFVETTPEEINRAVQQFLGLEDSPGARASSSTPEDPARVGDADVAPDQAPVKQPDETKDKGDGGAAAEDSNIVATTFGKELAKKLRARKTKLPIYYPTKLESGSDYAQKPRLYKINGTGEGSPPNAERAAYKWVFSRPTLGEYYGFMATRWKEPPILKNPSDEKEIGDRTYKLYYDGDRLRMIAWQTDEGSFWVSNTLAQSLSDREMLEIAKGMTELPMRGNG